MNLEEMRKHEWVVSWSGGKDSTATIILMHENEIPIKKIVYVRMMYDDKLPATLPVMTDFVDKTIKKLESWGYEVEVIKSLTTAKDLYTTIYKRSKYAEKNGKPYGMSAFFRQFCTFTSVKQRTIASLQSDDYEMIGYASDETERLGRLGDKRQSIMATLGVTEKDASEICKKYDMLSPLYDMKVSRDGCWFCPNAGERERERLSGRSILNYIKRSCICVA